MPLKFTISIRSPDIVKIIPLLLNTSRPNKICLLTIIDSKNLRFTLDDVGSFAFFAGGGFGPGFLEADVHGGVNHRAALDMGAGEEHEFAFVVDAFARHFQLVVHVRT